MKVELMNRIANSELNCYYDQSIGMIVVYFQKADNDKKDLVAYLNKNMNWDLREIKNETSTLFDDREEIIVKHNRLGHHALGTDLDKAIRSVIKNVIDYMEKEAGLDKNGKMIKSVLEKNGYEGVI